MGNKTLAGILGLAIGDAVGLPYQFHERDTFNCRDMVGWGTCNKPKGTISDDTSLTLATMESIGSKGKIDLEDMQRGFMAWYFYGDYTPTGKAFDIGRTTSMAIEYMRAGYPPG